MRLQARDPLAPLHERIDSPRVADRLADALKALSNALFRQRKNRRLGFVQNVVRIVGLLARFTDRGARHADQPAQDRLVPHHAHVVVDARPVRHAIQQARNVAHIADRLEVFVPVQFRHQRNVVNRPRRLRQLHHARVNPPVGIQRKVLRPQMLRRLVEMMVVEQDRAQNGSLRVDVRRHASDVAVDGRHDVQVSALHRNLSFACASRGNPGLTVNFSWDLPSMPPRRRLCQRINPIHSHSYYARRANKKQTKRIREDSSSRARFSSQSIPSKNFLRVSAPPR